MAEILLFHHAQGLTQGVRRFAEQLRQAGHRVHAPDLFDGRVFDTLAAGVAHAQQLGLDTLVARGRAIAAALPSALVYAGVSLGVLPAQALAQTRAGARAALFVSACVRPSDLGGAWPAGLPLQVHGMDRDPIFVGEGDLDAARALADGAAAELFLYQGDRHLFVDDSLPDYDAAAAVTLLERARALVASLPTA